MKEKRITRLKVITNDRHAEHALNSNRLSCDHDSIILFAGDRLMFNAKDGIDEPTLEIRFVDANTLEVTLNHLEYRYIKHALKRVRGEK